MKSSVSRPSTRASLCFPPRLRPRAPAVPARSPVSCQATAAAQTYAGDALSSIDANEYLSGTPSATFLGKLVSVVFPPPLRFLACWIPPITVILSVHASQVTQLIHAGLHILQEAVPSLTPLFAACNPPWLAQLEYAVICCLPALFTFLALPALDALLGEEEEHGDSNGSTAWYKPLYRIVCHGFAALHILAVGSAVAAVASGTFSLPLLALTALNCAISGGFAFAVAHELVHSKHALDRFVSQVMLTTLCYKHWGHSHIAHHAQVATPEDPASARYREMVYPFVLRSIIGEWQDAVRAEKLRIKHVCPHDSTMAQLLKSKIPGWFFWPGALVASVYAFFGPLSTGVFLAGAGGAVFFLEVINYVEHYGLLRQKLPSGQYERVSIQHSWNANHLLSNAALLRLQRHTDHHMHGGRPFYQLESVEGAPKLPASYSTMLLLALVPPLWFCVMNPRVHIHRLLSDVQRAA